MNSTAATRTLAGDVSTQRYTPFGETRTNGNLDTDRLYTGQIHDESSGLAFYNARYYDPTTKRFITPDSIVPNPNNGDDYNRYTYVRNNPIRYNDPTGNETCGTRDNRYVCWDGFELAARSVVNPDGSGGTEDLAYSCPYYNCRTYGTAGQSADGASLTSTLESRPRDAVDFSARADAASTVATAAEATSLLASGIGVTTPCTVFCAVTAGSAEAVGAVASVSEMYYGVRAGEPGHVVVGSVSLATLGASRTLTTTYKAQDRALGLRPDKLERFVIWLTIEAPVAGFNTVVSGLNSAYTEYYNELATVPPVR